MLDHSEIITNEITAKAPLLHLDFEVESITEDTVANVAGEGLSARIVGKPELVSGPTGGSAMHFGAAEGYLVIPHDDRMDYKVGEEFTIDFWYKLDSNARGGEILFEKGDCSVQVATADAGVDGVCWVGSEGSFRIGSAAAKNEWHHITVLQRDSMIFMFLDGVQVNGAPAKAHTSSAELVIGGKKTPFHGCIDDFMLYDYAVDMKVSGLMGADGDSFSYTDEKGRSISLVYRVYYPTDYDAKADKKYPLMFFLHGHGECGINNKAQLQVLNKSNKFLDDLSEMDNCIILAPQTYCDGATNTTEWIASGSHIRGKHIWDGGLGGMKARMGELSEIPYTLGLQAASALLDQFLALDTVDKDRVYIGGISMGGCGAWEMIARRPEVFAAAVPVCGSGIVSAAERLTKIAIWAFHGKADGTVLPEGSELICEAICAAGGNATYTGFDRVGHDSWNAAYSARNKDGLTAAEWVLNQHKTK